MVRKEILDKKDSEENSFLLLGCMSKMGRKLDHKAHVIVCVENKGKTKWREEVIYIYIYILYKSSKKII